MEAGGLVGMVDAGSLQISDSSMNGTINVDNSSSSYIAGLVGYFDAGSLQIDRCHVTSVMDITSEYTIVSGIANKLANAQDMTINNCYVSGAIKRGKQGKAGQTYTDLLMHSNRIQIAGEQSQTVIMMQKRKIV